SLRICAGRSRATRESWRRSWASPVCASGESPPGRQPEGERRARPGRGGDVERAAVRLNDRAGDEEPQPGARPRVARVRPAELLEDQLLIGPWDPRSAVAHRDADAPVVGE